MLKKVLLVPDAHVPYHDKAAFRLMLKAAKGWKPDAVVVLGDFCDFYAVSFHSKHPSRRANLEWEVDECISALEDIEKLNAKEYYYVAGNHEYRLERYLSDRAPELFGLLKFEELMELAPRWKYTPYKDYLKLGKLYLTHDCGKAGGRAHEQAQADFEGNVVIGHTHRMAYTVRGSAKGKAHVGCMLGWLGDAKKVDYMHRIKAARDWAHGFGIAYLEPNGVAHIQPIPIINGKCLIEGKLYT